MRSWLYRGCHPVVFFDHEDGRASISIGGSKQTRFDTMDAAIEYAAAEIKRRATEEMRNLASSGKLPPKNLPSPKKASAG